MPQPEDLQADARALLDDVAKVEPDITEAVKKAGGASGARLVDLSHRVKPLYRTAEKLADLTGRRGMSVDEAVRQIDDLLRYRVVTEPVSYAAAVSAAAWSLLAHGATVEAWDDHWSRSRYRGLNVTWRLGEQRFEVQFHTPASVAMAQDPTARELYEQARRTRGAERKRIDRQMVELWRAVPRPPGEWPVP